MDNIGSKNTGLRWRKASRSAGSGDECVEVARLAEGVAVRDSKAPDRPHLSLTRAQWRSLADHIAAGRLAP
ncbi:DUF397 domain-containing protein [Spirillospora sp. NPDC127200]